MQSDFASATLKELIGEDKLSGSVVFSADYFSHCILINDGQMNFTVQELLWHGTAVTIKKCDDC